MPILGDRIQRFRIWPDPDRSRIRQIHRISGQIQIRIWLQCTPSSGESCFAIFCQILWWTLDNQEVD